MPPVTFRDYAFAVMQNQIPTAVTHLQTLLGITETEAQTATAFFGKQVTDPAFLPKAMGLRAAVESGSDEDIGKILGDCFGLDDAQRATAVATVRVSYPQKS